MKKLASAWIGDGRSKAGVVIPTCSHYAVIVRYLELSFAAIDQIISKFDD